MAIWHDPDYIAFWLAVARSDLAGWLQLTPYAYAVIEGLHLVGISFFFGSIFLLDLRLLGLVARPATAGTARFLLGITAPAFAVVLASGVLLFIPAADRYATSPTFFVKMGVIFLGGLNALVLHATAWRSIRAWGDAARPPGNVRAAAALSILVWLGAIVLGRAMGYEQRQPPLLDLGDLPMLDL